MRSVNPLLNILFIISTFNLYSQEFEARLIVKDSGDSLLLKTGNVNFDIAGNYCFEAEKDNKYFVITNTQKYGPFKHRGGFSSGGELTTYAESGEYNSVTNKYYKNGQGTTLYGPVLMGDENEIITSDTRNNIALISTIGDKVYCYVNSAFVGELDRKDKPWSSDKWCNFSNNGDISYWIKNNNQYRLYVNFKLVDSGNTAPDIFKEKKSENKCPQNTEGSGRSYSKIEYPAADSAGKCSYFGLRNYYLYIVVNGMERKTPLSKYGVRAIPLSLSPNGDYWCMYKTDDSSFIYHNEELVAKNTNFKVRLLNTGYILQHFYKDNTCRLFGFSNDKTSYLIYNNTIAPGIPKITGSQSDSLELGAILCSGLNENGYWLIQKTGFKKYQMVINNKIFNLANQVYDETQRSIYILQRNCFLTGREFIFYGQQGNSFYRYKVNL